MIRQFREDDTDAVVTAWRLASERAHPFLSKAFLDREAEALRTVYLGVAETWVCEADGRVVGFIALIENEVAGLFLDPRHHRRGLGKAMLDKAVSVKGALKVEVFKQNTSGRQFYAAYGFRALDECVHEPSGQATVQMVLPPQ